MTKRHKSDLDKLNDADRPYSLAMAFLMLAVVVAMGSMLFGFDPHWSFVPISASFVSGLVMMWRLR